LDKQHEDDDDVGISLHNAKQPSRWPMTLGFFSMMPNGILIDQLLTSANSLFPN